MIVTAFLSLACGLSLTLENALPSVRSGFRVIGFQLAERAVDSYNAVTGEMRFACEPHPQSSSSNLSTEARMW